MRELPHPIFSFNFEEGRKKCEETLKAQLVERLFEDDIFRNIFSTFITSGKVLSVKQIEEAVWGQRDDESFKQFEKRYTLMDKLLRKPSQSVKLLDEYKLKVKLVPLIFEIFTREYRPPYGYNYEANLTDLTQPTLFYFGYISVSKIRYERMFLMNRQLLLRLIKDDFVIFAGADSEHYRYERVFECLPTKRALTDQVFSPFKTCIFSPNVRREDFSNFYFSRERVLTLMNRIKKWDMRTDLKKVIEAAPVLLKTVDVTKITSNDANERRRARYEFYHFSKFVPELAQKLINAIDAAEGDLEKVNLREVIVNYHNNVVNPTLKGKD